MWWYLTLDKTFWTWTKVYSSELSSSPQCPSDCLSFPTCTALWRRKKQFLYLCETLSYSAVFKPRQSLPQQHASAAAESQVSPSMSKQRCSYQVPLFCPFRFIYPLLNCKIQSPSTSLPVTKGTQPCWMQTKGKVIEESWKPVVALCPSPCMHFRTLHAASFTWHFKNS